MLQAKKQLMSHDAEEVYDAFMCAADPHQFQVGIKSVNNDGGGTEGASLVMRALYMYEIVAAKKYFKLSNMLKRYTCTPARSLHVSTLMILPVNVMVSCLVFVATIPYDDDYMVHGL